MASDSTRGIARGLGRAFDSFREDLEDSTAYAVGLLLAFGWVWVSGGFFGLTVFQTGALVGVSFTLLFITATSRSDLSYPFVLSLFALLALVWSMLPASLQGAFPVEFFTRLLGLEGTIEANPLSAIQLAVTTFIAIFVYWVVTIRAGSGPKNPNTVLRAILGTGEGERKGKLTQLVEEYVTIGRMVVGFGLIFVVFLFRQGGELAGVIGNVLAQAPFVSSNLAAGIVGWFALGGRISGLEWIPVVGIPLQNTLNSIGLSPGGWALFIIVVLAAAAAVRYS